MIRPFIALLGFLVMSACSDTGAGNSSTETEKELPPFEETYNVECVDTIVHESGTAVTGYEPAKAAGAPKGGGEEAASLDVFVTGEAGVARFSVSGVSLIDSTGADFKVFENPFIASDGKISWDLGWVEISPGGSGDASTWPWYLLPVTYSGGEREKAGKSGMTGMNTVAVHETENRIDPRLTEAGGDAFDLADARKITSRGDGSPLNFITGNSLAADNITEIKYIRVYDGGSHLADGQVFSNGSDIDAICYFNYQSSS